MISLNCEKCGGIVELDEAQESGCCVFCNTKVVIKSDTIIHQTTQNITKHVYGHHGKDIDELIDDGLKLIDIGDKRKANEKFKRAIDIDPDCWGAWLGFAATGGDRTSHLSCVPAYLNAYNLASGIEQEIVTFNDMAGYLPDSNIRSAFIDAYKVASDEKRLEMFQLVSGVIGRDDTEIARLAIDLCHDDWRAWFAMAKIRQIRVRWCDEPVRSFFLPAKLPEHVVDVLNIFVKAYQLAKQCGDEAKKTVLMHISNLESDKSYKVFARELRIRIKREG
jgi:tetratricopeptide (TPR) repeat protein